MGLAFYFMVFAASVGLMGLGRVVLPGTPHGRALIAGAVLAGGVAGSLAWLAPVAVVPFCKVAVSAGWVAVALELVRWWRRGRPVPRLRGVATTAFGASIGIGMCLPYHYRFVDLGIINYVLGPFVEFFLADYVGPVRIPTYYPWETSAAHILPSTVLAALGSLLDRPTMLDGLEIRFLLQAFMVGRFAKVALDRSTLPVPQAAALVALCLYLFHWEMQAGFGTSSVILTVLMAEVGLALLFDEQAPERTARDVLFLLTAAAAAKASVFYLPVLVGLWVAARFPRAGVHPAVILGGLVTFLHLLTTSMRPSTFPDVHVRLSPVDPSGGRATFDYYPYVRDAFSSSDLMQLLGPHLLNVGLAMVLVLVALKYWAIPVRALGNLAAAAPERREILRVVEVMLVLVLVAFVLVRHDQHGEQHQSWLIYGSAPVVMAAVLARILTRPRIRAWVSGVAVAAALQVASGYDPWRDWRPPSSPHLGGVTFDELKAMNEDEVLLPRPGDSPFDPCERALLKGMRIEAGRVPLGCLGALGTMVVEPGR